MKKKVFLIPVLLLVFASLEKTPAQGISLGIGGGYTNIISPDNHSGWHLEAKGGLSLPLAPLNPVAFVKYQNFGGSDFNIFSIGAGGEYNLIPGPFNSYLLLNAAYNNFSTIGSRYGLGFGFGAKAGIIDADLSYNFLNLAGKNENEETVNAISLNIILLIL